MVRLIAIAFLLLIQGCRTTIPSREVAPEAPNEASESIKKMMAGTIIAKVRLDNVSPAEALDFWNTAGLERGGWNSIGQFSNKSKVINIIEENMNSLDLLNEICRQAELEWSLEPRWVAVRPKK